MCNMSYTPNYIETLKVKSGNRKDCLHDMCNWLHPDKPAIEYHDLEEITIINYSELQTAKDTVCSHLKCIQYPEFIGINYDILGYCVPALMLGILDSGHSFFNVPSDPSIYKVIFTSLYVKYIFTKSVTSNREIICQLDIHGQSIYLIKLPDVQESIASNRRWHCFAYAIATSGTTGTPKVVKVPHSCILPNITDLWKILDITKPDKIGQLTDLTFDPSLIETFLSIFCSTTLFMVSKALKNEADRLLEKIFRAHVTVLQITPSLLFHKWSIERLKTTILGKESKLRILLLGGEPFPNIKLLSTASHPQNMTRLFNIYGITEVSCWSSINEIIKGDNSTDESYLGKPLSQTIFQIRNERDEVIILGTGNLHIGSNSRVCIIGNEPEENLNKLIFRNTGDIVSTDDQGRIFYRGRQNNVIKRFGNKVNLRYLEKVIMELSFVRNCIAFWDQTNHKLYLCLSTKKTKEEFSNLKNDILTHLKILPVIYKPDKIIMVEHFNLTSSGKICIAWLKKICRDSELEIINVDDLHNKTDDILGTLWNDHVKSKDISFLMSGGTSIAALQISSTIAKIFKMEFPELIGMLLKDITFDEYVHYIRNTVINRNWSGDVTYIDVSSNDHLPLKISKTENSITQNISSNNLPTLTKQEGSYQWYKCRGKTYNALAVQNIEPLLTNISNIKILKTYNLQKCIDASPTVYCYSESELFATVGSHSGIICTINLLDITKRPYEVKLPDRIEASVLVLADFRGIIGCYDGYVYCIHLKTGEIIWKFQTQDMIKCTAITCTQRSRIFVGSYDHHVYCLAIKDGTQIWKTKGSQRGICATGCLHKKSISVLFGTLDGTCLALQESTGRVIWKRQLTDPIFVAPVVLQTDYVLFCSVAGTLCCYDIETDCQLWRYVVHGNVFSYPVVRAHESTNSEYVILTSHNKNLYCLELPYNIVLDDVDDNGMKKYEAKLRYMLQLHSPIFATSWCEDEHIFVACTDGTLKAFNILEGRLLATKQLSGEIFSSPVVHKDLVVLGCRDDNLYVLKLD